MDASELFAQNKHFSRSEFDSPDVPGSGRKMQPAFLARLFEAREIAGIPFKITSGYRTEQYNRVLERRGYKVAKNSPHLRGWAADIKVTTSAERYTIVRALQEVGFNRIGIGKSFIHVDCDPSKVPFLMWHYY